MNSCSARAGVRSPSRARFGLVAGLLWLLLGTASLRAQFSEAWVNPQTGNDATGAVNVMTSPFKTIAAAISAVAAFIATSGGEGIVRALPGLYSDDPARGNGEHFPIFLVDKVHLQGAGAKECVLRNMETTPGSTPVWQFLPTRPRGHTVQVHMILNCNGLSTYETSVEGFTFQGGFVQIGTWAERAESARISNCVFDLRVGGEDSLPPPDFGILLVPIWDYVGGAGHYNALTWHVLNNTFLHGYLRTAGGVSENAAPNSVGLCNVNDPADYKAPFNDPGPLRGVSDLNVQNNLFRHLVGTTLKRTAMLGIDGGDATVAVGTAPGPTNAFDPDTIGGGNALYISGIVGSPPLPKVIINRAPGVGVDPGFLGEMISQKQAAILVNPFVRDWRLLPDSALVDQGSAPIYLGSAGTLVAVNGVTLTDNKTSPVSSFDWDGDGLGSPRIVGANPDIGFDETDLFHVAGCYGNDSKSHNLPFHPSIRAGNPWRTLIFPSAGLAQIWYTMQPVVSGVGWTWSPGTGPGVPGPAGVNYLDPLSIQFLNPGPVAWDSWVNPVDGRPHRFGKIMIFANEAGPPAIPPSHLNEQVLYQPTTGGPARLSNLQFEIF